MSRATPIYLPPPEPTGGTSLAEAINRRRSVRDYTTQPVSQPQLSQILWAAQGMTGPSGGYRAVPSAGATYPLEVFIVCGDSGIEDMDDGIYRYDSHRHSLEQHQTGEFRRALARAALARGRWVQGHYGQRQPPEARRIDVYVNLCIR